MTLSGLAAVLAVLAVVLDPRPGEFPARTVGVWGLTRPDRAFLKINGLKGNVDNPLWWGSYLTWKLYPDVAISNT